MYNFHAHDESRKAFNYCPTGPESPDKKVAQWENKYERKYAHVHEFESNASALQFCFGASESVSSPAPARRLTQGPARPAGLWAQFFSILCPFQYTRPNVQKVASTLDFFL